MTIKPTTGPRPKRNAVTRRAWELHRAHGHPKWYDGPCWGPTLAEWEQAKLEIPEAS